MGVKVSHSHIETGPGVFGLVRSYLAQWSPRGEAICNDICCCGSKTLLTPLTWVLCCRTTAPAITFVNIYAILCLHMPTDSHPKMQTENTIMRTPHTAPRPSIIVLQRGPRSMRAPANTMCVNLTDHFRPLVSSEERWQICENDGHVARVERRTFGRRWPRKFEHANAYNRWIHSYTMCCTQKFVTPPWGQFGSRVHFKLTTTFHFLACLPQMITRVLIYAH